jgi:hypothetical protein
MNEQQLTEKVLHFLATIEIPVDYRSVQDEECFLPGLLIENGSIIIDKGKMKYPGDILHEAGHIAVVPAAERGGLNGKDIGRRKDNAAEEMMAIAWSYAACVHLEIDPYFVFHENGYKGGGHSIADGFKEGRYFGVPMLEWTGMTDRAEKNDKSSENTYPKMINWLRN